MKSVGEAMAIGRTFKESLQKALRSLEIGRYGLGGDGRPWRVGTETYEDRDILPRDVIMCASSACPTPSGSSSSDTPCAPGSRSKRSSTLPRSIAGS
jgi:hypothetical protein